jgi:dehydratase ilvD1
MEDLHYAGGLPAVMKELATLLHVDAPTAWGPTIGESFAAAECFNREVIHTMAEPANTNAGIWVLEGQSLPQRRGHQAERCESRALYALRPAIVFESIEDLHARIDDPALEVDANSVLVLKGCGPQGYPGMPEVGNMPLPRKLLERGVQDMLRISDARMSGTAFGTVVLHVAPESNAGGPLALVQTAIRYCLDGPNRRLERAGRTGGARRARRGLDAAQAAAEVFARLLSTLRRARDAGGSRLRPRFSDRFQRQHR